MERNWALPARNVGLKKFWEKQHMLKQYLVWWNKNVFGDLFASLKALEAEVVDLELVFYSFPSDSALENLKAKSSEFQSCSDMEEHF